MKPSFIYIMGACVMMLISMTLNDISFLAGGFILFFIALTKIFEEKK